ncbi:MAG TPA: glycosyltransferase family 4 protein [Candidatus Sulfotelmatobacter sp.]|nr:glycosyltransferase family 4 protein [Candidatus Sulfotelmatobacter sp.]
MNSKPKLLYLIGQFPAINHGYLLAEVRHLRRLGFNLEVMSVSPPDRPVSALTEPEREEAARTYCIKSLSAIHISLMNAAEFFRDPLRYLKGFFFALRLAGPSPKAISYHLAYLAESVVVGRRMRQLRISHVHASFSATVALIAAKIFPITWSFGVYGFGELHDPTVSHLRERIDSARFVRSISKFGRGQLMLSCDRSHWPRLLYSPLGIEVADFVPHTATATECEAVRLLCVGRLSEEKGQALLLEAIAGLTAQKLRLQLHVVGDGPDRRWLETYADQLGISSNIAFEGWIDVAKLMALYARTDIFVLSSLAEGIPMVLIEAMALEKPCVAPRISGIPELIDHGLNGLLFSAADVDELSQQIRTLSQSFELRRKLGKEARQKVLHEYDMTRNTERFAAILERQLS